MAYIYAMMALSFTRVLQQRAGFYQLLYLIALKKMPSFRSLTFQLQVKLRPWVF